MRRHLQSAKGSPLRLQRACTHPHDARALGHNVAHCLKHAIPASDEKRASRAVVTLRLLAAADALVSAPTTGGSLTLPDRI